jgi:hypothetical protein
MSDDEFKAPDWVGKEVELEPITAKQRIGFLITLAFAIPFCLWAGWYEWTRAQEGHWRAWVYAFEWPFFAVVLIYLYRRFTRGDRPRIPRPKFPDFKDGEN